MEHGIELTRSEVAALVATDSSVFDRVAEALDPGCRSEPQERRVPVALRPEDVVKSAVLSAALVALAVPAAAADRPITLFDATALALKKNHDIAIEQQSFQIAARRSRGPTARTTRASGSTPGTARPHRRSELGALGAIRPTSARTSRT